MRHFLPGPDEMTPEQLIEIRALEVGDTPPGTPVNLADLVDVALGARFPAPERRAARIELARVYAATCAGNVVTRDALTDMLLELAKWAEARLFDDDQDPALDTPDERLVRAYTRWQAVRGIS